MEVKPEQYCNCFVFISVFVSYLPTRTAVVSPPRQRELTGADHTHGSPQVRDPYWGFGAQRNSVSFSPQLLLAGRGFSLISYHTLWVTSATEINAFAAATGSGWDFSNLPHPGTFQKWRWSSSWCSRWWLWLWLRATRLAQMQNWGSNIKKSKAASPHWALWPLQT